MTSGLRFDLDALVDSPGAFLRVPPFLLALLLVRGGPALLYVRSAGRGKAVAAGLLQATSLPFIVTAVEIGVLLDQISPVDGAALIGAGLLSVVAFPPLAVSLLRDRAQPEERLTGTATEVSS